MGSSGINRVHGGTKLFKIKMKATQIFLFLLIAMMMAMVRTKPHCPGGWSLYFREKMCYKFFRGQRTYSSAKSLCKEQGGVKAQLAIASNIGRNNYISFVFTDQIVWLGGRRVHGSNTWKWDDGTPWSYKNWRHNEPNNNQGREDCIIINWGSDRRGWNDFPCSNTAQTICQVPPH